MCSTIAIWSVHIRFSSTKTAIIFTDEDLFISYALIVRIGSWSSRLYLFLKNWDSLHARRNSHYDLWSYKKKKHIKVKEYRKSVLKKMSVNSRLKVTKIIGQRKAFSRQRIPESICGKERNCWNINSYNI